MRVRFPRDGGTAGTRPGVKWYAARKRLGTTAIESTLLPNNCGAIKSECDKDKVIGSMNKWTYKKVKQRMCKLVDRA